MIPSSTTTRPKVKIFAMADSVPKPNRRYLTAKKRYPVKFDHGRLFEIIDDEGDTLLCCWKWSAHLDGDCWQRIEEHNRRD